MIKGNFSLSSALNAKRGGCRRDWDDMYSLTRTKVSFSLLGRRCDVPSSGSKCVGRSGRVGLDH